MNNRKLLYVLLLLFGLTFLYFGKAAPVITAQNLKEDESGVTFKVRGKALRSAYQHEIEVIVQVPDQLYQKNTEIWIRNDQDTKGKLYKEAVWKENEKGYKSEVKVRKGQNISVEVRHLAQEAPVVSSVFSIDQKAPLIRVQVNGQAIDSLAESYTQKMKFEVFFEDENPDATKYEIKIQKGKEQMDLPLVWNADKTSVRWLLDEDAKYRIQIRAEDSAGNYSYFNKYRKGFQLDTTQPYVRVLEDDWELKQGNVLRREKETALTVRVKEDYFDKKKSYILRNGQRQKTTWNKVGDTGDYQTIVKADTTREEDIGIHVEDIAGNVYESLNYCHLSIDLDAPIGKLFFNEIDSEGQLPNFFRTNVQVRMQVDEKRLDLQQSYLLVNDKRIPLDWQNTLSGYEALYELKEGENHVSYHLQDQGSRVSESSHGSSFIVDTQAPKARIEMSGLPYQRSTQKIKIKVMDSNLNPDDIHIYDKGNIKRKLKWQKLDHGYASELFIDTEGAHSIQIDAVDMAGNLAVYALNDGEYTTRWEPINFIMDKTAPRVSMTRSKGYYSNASRQTVHITQIEEHPVDRMKLRVMRNGKEIHTPIREMIQGNRIEYQLVFDKEGHYVVQYESVDRADNQAEYHVNGNKAESGTLDFVLDHSAPQIKLELLEQGHSNHSQTVQLQVSDDYLKDYEVQVIRNGVVMSRDIYNKAETRILTMQEKEGNQGQYEISVKAKDRAGNTQEAKTVSFLIDHKLPQIKVDLNGLFLKQGAAYLTNQNVQMHISSSDEQFAYQKVQLYKNDKLVQTIQNKDAVDLIIPAKKGENHQYTVKIESTDTAGNVRVSEKNFEVQTKIHKLAIKNDVFHGKPYAGSWTPELSDKTKEYQIVDARLYKDRKLQAYRWGDKISQDGDYKLELIVQDKAHNQTHLSPAFRFVIDQTGPQISLLDTLSGKEVLDHVLPDTTILVKLADTGQGKEEIISVLINGKKVEKSKEGYQLVLEDSGTYDISVSARDEAGNVSKMTRKIQVSEHPPVSEKADTSSKTVRSVENVNSHTQTIWFYAGGIGLLLMLGAVLYVRRRS